MERKVITNEMQDDMDREYLNTKMRNTRKKPYTIEKTPRVYDMSSPIRGWCLIFSNHVFNNLGKLIGYEVDKDNFSEVFKELHFEIKVYTKVTANEIKSAIKEHANKSASDGIHPTNAITVVILSHGNENFLCGYNYDPKCPKNRHDKITIDEIKDLFSNKNCPHLIDKPKLFFLQACRGDSQDDGLNSSIVKNHENIADVATTLRSGRRINSESDFSLPSVAEDMIICYATLPNYRSFVTSNGSIFGIKLCVELKRWAWHRDLHEIISSANSAIRKKDIPTPSGIAKQVIHLHYTSPNKRLFFNPGYYKIRDQLVPHSVYEINAPGPSTSNGRNGIVRVSNDLISDENRSTIHPSAMKRRVSEISEISDKKIKKESQKGARSIKLIKGQTSIKQYFQTKTKEE